MRRGYLFGRPITRRKRGFSSSGRHRNAVAHRPALLPGMPFADAWTSGQRLLGSVW